nr:M20/M25/M40 family metallo-hydrolase [Streptomyces sp. DSM 41633]
RGAVDMKDMCGMMIAVARHLKRNNITPPRDLVFAFVSDEEHGGTYGCQWLVDNRPDLFDGVTEAIGEVAAAQGPPLIVVGQAKYQRPGDFADITDVNAYRESFEAHTLSQILLLQAVLPAMKDAGWGRFVHIGSATAKEPAGSI